MSFDKSIPEGVPKNISSEKFGNEKTIIQKEILEKLHAAANSEARVHTFATLVDTFGLDVLLGLIPVLGDAGASGLAGVYLLYEAKRAGLKKTAYLKIIGLQAADFAIGAIPLLGDAADYFFKAVHWSEKAFQQKTAELVKKARAAGIPDPEITKITAAAEKLPQLVSRANHFAVAGNIKSRLKNLKKTA